VTIRLRRWSATDGRLIVEDTKGRLWERTKAFPYGVWGLIQLPEEPKRQRVKPGRGSKP
jgi:hypothetical protein